MTFSTESRTDIEKAIDNKYLENFNQYGYDIYDSHGMDINGNIEQSGATQRTGNCWLMGTLNAITTSKEGKNLLKNIYFYNEKLGIVAVKIPESNKIYTFSKYEIDKYGEKYSKGDNDIAAINIAIEQYFKDSKEEFLGMELNVGDGNSVESGFEILTGKRATQIDSDQNFPIGLSKTIIRYGNNTDKIFDNIIDCLKEKNSSINLAFRFNYNSIIAQHAFSVVGYNEKGQILLEESNNSAMFANVYKLQFLDINKKKHL